MFFFLNIFSKSRKLWIALILSAIGLLSITLLIQHFFLLKSCVLCVYQRCALFGIIISGLIAVINPNTSLRFFSILIWMYSAFKGLNLAKKNISAMSSSSPFFTCDLTVTFPKWMPLNKWCPIIFNAEGGNCFDYKWYFLSLEMSQWMLLIFTSYLILAIFTMIAQFNYLQK